MSYKIDYSAFCHRRFQNNYFKRQITILSKWLGIECDCFHVNVKHRPFCLLMDFVLFLHRLLNLCTCLSDFISIKLLHFSHFFGKNILLIISFVGTKRDHSIQITKRLWMLNIFKTIPVKVKPWHLISTFFLSIQLFLTL